MDTEFSISFEDFGDGLSPLAHIDNKTFKGSKGQASEMRADVISNPGFLQQSPALSTLTNGDQTGVVTEQIRYILDKPVASDTTFAVGTSKLFKLSSTTVASSGWPRTITNMTAGESIVRLKNHLYVFYNKSTDGDIAALPLSELYLARSPQTAANDTGIGSVAWTNPSNALVRDQTRTSVELASGQISNYLKLTNFNFNIPSGATIKGIVVDVLCSRDSNTMISYAAKIVKGGSVTGSDLYGVNSSLPSDDNPDYVSFGKKDELPYGLSLTASDVNDSNFGVVFAVKASGGDDIAYVDHVRIRVFYTTTEDGEVWQTWGSEITAVDQKLEKALHPSAAKEDIMVFGNGRYLGVFIEGSGILDIQRLDFGEGAEVADVVFHSNMWWIAVNYGEGRRGQIYLYDGSAMSNILSDEVGLGSQRIGFLFVLNGIVYVCYDDLTADGFAIGWVSGRQIKPLRYFSGTLPDHRQKTLYKNTILFVSGQDVYSFGAPVEQVPIQISRLASGGYSNVGGIAAPFGVPMVASSDGTSNYRLAKFSGLATSGSYWKSVFVDTTKNRKLGKIHTVIVSTKALETGARADLTLEGNQGAITSNTMQITGANKTRHVFRNVSLKAVEDVRVAIDFQNGSSTKNCPIRKIELLGNFVER